MGGAKKRKTSTDARLLIASSSSLILQATILKKQYTPDISVGIVGCAIILARLF